MRKVFNLIMLLVLTSIFLFGCEKPPEQNSSSPASKKGLLATLTNQIAPPDKILKNYLEASLHNLNEEAYKYVSEKDKKIKSLDEYLAENKKKEESPFALALASKITYSIESIDKNEDEAKAIIAITMPDFGAIFMDLMGAAFASSFSGEKNDAEIQRILAEKYADKEIPLTTTKENFTLLKESDGWKVFLDWEKEKLEKERERNEKLAEAENFIQEEKYRKAIIIYDQLLDLDSKDQKALNGLQKASEAQKIAEEKKKKVESLLSEASELKRKKKLHGALAKYNEILELDSTIVEAQEGAKETDVGIKKFQEKQDYLPKVELKDFKVSEGKKYSFGDPEPGIFGTIVNNGDKTLSEVEITVYFLDKNGTVIGEEDFHPVLMSTYSFGGDNKPLKPNYVKDFGYSVKDYAPSAWAGKVNGKITNIEFME